MRRIFGALAFSCLALSAQAQNTSPVTLDNFIRAETDMYFGNFVKDAGGIGTLNHHRQPTPIENQNVIRLNRDTLYSWAVFDLDAGPVTITMPDSGTRFMSLMSINEDHFIIDTAHRPSSFTYSKEKVGTRYLALGLRTLVDANNPADIKEANQLQDKVKVEQASAGQWDGPNWDLASQKKVRDAIAPLAQFLPDTKHFFGKKGAVDPVQHLVATAIGWGGTPPEDATYLVRTPKENDGKTQYQLTVKDVPVDGFWSVTVYNKDGYLEKNPQDIYSFNNLTAKKNPDGSTTINFGGDPAKTPNSIPIMKDWNYAVRLYLPRAEILSGQWKFPEAQAVN